MQQPEAKQCAALTKRGKQCEKDVLKGLNYCWNHRDSGNGGGSAPKPSGGDKGPGGAGKILRGTADGVRIADYLARAWEWIQENADIFLSAKQITLYGQLIKQRNEASQRALFAKLLSGLSADQWARLLAAVGMSLIVQVRKGNVPKKLAR